MARLESQPVAPDSGRWKPVVRGYPENMEVLTEHGFIAFSDLNSSSLLRGEIPFVGNSYNAPGFPMNDLEWTQYQVADTFPRVATVDPKSGEVEFVSPSMFIKATYRGELVHVKAKGVDVFCTVYADLFLKGKYGRDYSFVLADNPARSKVSNAAYYMVDKFSQSLYGEYEPKTGLFASLTIPITLRPDKHVRHRRIGDVFEYRAVDSFGRRVKVDRVRTEVDVFNIVVAPYHTLIVRQRRKDSNPRTPWVGNPVIVGDGYDKSLMRIEALKAVGERRKRGGLL